MLGTVLLLIVLLVNGFFDQDRFDARMNKDIVAFKESAKTAYMHEAQINAISTALVKSKEHTISYVSSMLIVFSVLITLAYCQLTVHYQKLKDKE